MVQHNKSRTSESMLGTTSVTTLSIVPNGVVDPHTDLVRDELLPRQLLDCATTFSILVSRCSTIAPTMLVNPNTSS